MPENIKFSKSPRKNKKYRVEFDLGKKRFKVDFGDNRYEHFEDKTPLKIYSNLNHKDKDRRRKYLARASMIKNNKGQLTKNNPLSANYWAIRYLW